MVVLAANVTNETISLISKLLDTSEFVRFKKHNSLNLGDKTVLFRLALINLIQNLPNDMDVSRYRAALLRPKEFDSFLKEEIEKVPVTV